MRTAVVVFHTLGDELAWIVISEFLVPEAKHGLRKCGTPAIAIIRLKPHHYEPGDYE